MVTKDHLKSARKKFMVNRVKTTIMGLHDAPDSEVEARLAEIEAPLVKTFGQAEATQILEDAIDAADEVITGAIRASVVESVKDAKKDS